MANIKSQKKRVITNAKKQLQNKAVKSNLKTSLKKAEIALADQSADRAAVVSDAYSVIDRAAKHGVIHPNAAARKKAAFAKKGQPADN